MKISKQHASTFYSVICDNNYQKRMSLQYRKKQFFFRWKHFHHRCNYLILARETSFTQHALVQFNFQLPRIQQTLFDICGLQRMCTALGVFQNKISALCTCRQHWSRGWIDDCGIKFIRPLVLPASSEYLIHCNFHWYYELTYPSLALAIMLSRECWVLEGILWYSLLNWQRSC